MKKIKIIKQVLNEVSVATVGLKTIDPGGVSAVDPVKSTLAGGFEGPILIQNPSGAAFDPSDKGTRLGMGFQITPQDYDAARNVAKQYGVDIDKADKPWQALNKARQNERIQMVKQKGIEMGLVNPNVGLEELPISQNASPQTVLDSPINQWLWDTIRNANVAFAKQNQETETVQENIDLSVQPQQQSQQPQQPGGKQRKQKPKPDYSAAMGFKVDPRTESSIKATIQKSGIKPEGNPYKDLNAAQNRIRTVDLIRRKMKGI